jgi:hypothetical protein
VNRVSDVWNQEPGGLLRSALLYGARDEDGGPLLLEKLYAMPDLPVRLRPDRGTQGWDGSGHTTTLSKGWCHSIGEETNYSIEWKYKRGYQTNCCLCFSGGRFGSARQNAA